MGTNSTEFLKNIIGTAYKTQQEINKQKKAQQRPFTPGTFNPPVEVDKHLIRVIYGCFLAIFAFVGAEPVKVIYRKNFGKGGLHPICLVVSCALFGILGVVSILAAFAGLSNDIVPVEKMRFIQAEGGFVSYAIIGVLYLWIATYVYTKGMKDIKESNKNRYKPGYTGDSELLIFLKKEGWSEGKIKWIGEPLSVFLIGIAICFLNLLGGIPIIVCSLSLVIYSAIDHFLLQNELEDTINQMKNQAGGYQETYNVD